MLPKVSFTDDRKEENGSKMLSRFGKMTTYNYPIFRGPDPVTTHSRFVENKQREEAAQQEWEMQHVEEQKRLEARQKD